MAINGIDRGGLHWKGKLAPHVWFANFYSNPFILFVGYYSFLHQGPGGGERWENVGPFRLPKAPLCFSRFFAFWLKSKVTQQSRYWWYFEFASPAAEHKSL